ncbi:TetR/AcrR family transcriptional regulator [Pseudomaricurvus alkylphenolicus]|uniref:TetR/AcrR family transcriptional regulator n=1 Tax=Pseudomaricurvus alkylphenolicus TaxID=1306991 RepID=UPI001422ECB1|nr:TetR/AcrR family transcriptional regulator [Pseudomaricurvus alkylphenolicus]NIB44085.1 TetR/AcrR family transcriptional regulator [Pseudomaricurvus alkylphenolicus]
MKNSNTTTSKNKGTGVNSKVETIKNILQAARHEFAYKGLEKANVQHIAENAGVTKQLIYHYYKNKEQLFACVLDEYSNQAMSETVALELDHIPPRDALRTMILHMFDQYHGDHELASLATEGIRYHASHTTPGNRFIDFGPRLTQKMRKIIERGVRTGVFSTDLNPDLVFTTAALMVANAFTSRYVISVLSGLDTGEADAMETWRNHTVELILAAVVKT